MPWLLALQNYQQPWHCKMEIFSLTYQRPISQEVLKIGIHKMSLKNTLVNLQDNRRVDWNWPVEFHIFLFPCQVITCSMGYNIPKVLLKNTKAIFILLHFSFPYMTNRNQRLNAAHTSSLSNVLWRDGGIIDTFKKTSITRLPFSTSHWSTMTESWGPSQYKDRLIYVWRFPC